MVIYYSIAGEVSELITLASAKMQLRVDDIVTHEDDLITAYITEAREIAEGYIGRLIGERALTIKSSDFIDAVEAEYSPINSITSIKAYDDNEEEKTLTDVTDYELVNIGIDSKLIRYEDDNLPDLSTTKDTPVTTVATVGFSTTNCPMALIAAMKLIITYLYENREDRAQEKQSASHNIMRKYKKWA